MKKCPFCAEEIQDEAIKCRFCNEFLDKVAKAEGKPKVKWYFSNTAVVVAILSLGPLALPLVWLNPRYKILTKSVLTIVVIVLTVWTYYMVKDLCRNMNEQFKMLGI